MSYAEGFEVPICQRLLARLSQDLKQLLPTAVDPDGGLRRIAELTGLEPGRPRDLVLLEFALCSAEARAVGQLTGLGSGAAAAARGLELPCNGLALIVYPQPALEQGDRLLRLSGLRVSSWAGPACPPASVARSASNRRATA